MSAGERKTELEGQLAEARFALEVIRTSRPTLLRSLGRYLDRLGDRGDVGVPLARRRELRAEAHALDVEAEESPSARALEEEPLGEVEGEVSLAWTHAESPSPEDERALAVASPSTALDAGDEALLAHNVRDLIRVVTAMEEALPSLHARIIDLERQLGRLPSPLPTVKNLRQLTSGTPHR